MGKKTSIRIIGEVLTFVSNLLMTLSIIGAMVYIYSLKPMFDIVIGATDYYDMGLNVINNFLNALSDNIMLILSVGVTIIALIWVMRGIIIRSRSKALSIIAIIFNIANLVGLIGYSFILYDNLQPKRNNTDYEDTDDDGYKYRDCRDNKSKYGLGIILGIILAPCILIFFKGNTDRTENVIKPIKGEYIQKNEVIDIREDYRNKADEIEDVALGENGIVRYNSILINHLRGYSIKNIEDAKVVYEISDEMLNNLYQECKSYMTEASFIKLRDKQRVWVKNKAEVEKGMKDDELNKYKKLIDITLHHFTSNFELKFLKII